MFGRRADGMAFNLRNQIQVGTVISEIRSFKPQRTAKVETDPWVSSGVVDGNTPFPHRFWAV
jgi:hypothetical protein